MKLKRIMASILVICMVLSTMGFAVLADEVNNVAKVGNTEYATIDEAIAAWTNNTTLTLLSDVTLSDVITLKSTEHHILDLGTYTMTAASGKNGIEIMACGTGDAERYAITINADTTNPGSINAGSKSVIYYNYANGGITTNDRPIIKINGGVFAGATSSWGTAGIYFKGGSVARQAATLNISGGTFNCSINGQSKSKLIITGGTFNYSVGSQGDSTANRLISGGTFKTLGFMTADSNNTKFWFGTSMGNSNVGVYVDDNGYIVVGGPVVTEAGDTFEASANYSGANSLLQYSSAKNNGLYYTSVEEALADNNKTTGSVTVYADEIDMTGISYKGTIVVPQGETLKVTNAPEGLKVQDTTGKELVANSNGIFGAVEEIETNADVIVEGVNVEIAPVDGVANSYEITLAEGETWTDGAGVAMTFPAVEGAADGDFAYVVHEHEGVNYIYVGEVADGSVTITNTVGFSTFTVYEGGLEEAFAAAQAGDEIILLTDVEGDINVPADVTFNGNGFAVNGILYALGDITFAGYTKIAKFDFENVGTEINIGAGACLEVAGEGRMVIGHGCIFNIEGNIADAKTANVAELTPSLIMPGASFTGAGVTFNVKNAYIKTTASYCSSSKSASGTFDFNIENSIWEQFGKLAFEAQSTAATVNFDLKDSVLTTTSHLVFGVSEGEIVIDNSNVNVGTSYQIENQSTMTIKNGSVVNGAVATSSNAKNPGTIIVEDATYAVTGQFSGSDLGIGTLIIKKNANVSVGSIVDKANIVIDATGMTADDTINFNGNLSNFAGTVEVINNDALEAKIIEGKIVLVAKPVAQIGDTEYETLAEALKAATEGCTITLLDNITINEAWDCRNNGAKFTVPVTIDGNGKTLKLTGAVDDKNWNTVFRFEADATVKNLTIDASEATDIQRGISAKSNITVENCTFIGNGSTAKRGIIYGEGAGAAESTVTATISGCTFKNWSYGVSDSQSGKDSKSVSITGSTFENANALVSASETVTFTDNTMTGGYVNISSYTAENTCNVTATGNVLDLKATKDNTIKVGGEIVAQEGFVLPFDGENINNLADLKAFRDSVNEGNNYQGKTVVLNADVDLDNEEWTPISTFNGTFDGKNHTISNLVINGGSNSNQGFFGQTNNGEIKNVTFNNAKVSGYLNVGVVAGTPYTSKYSNIKVTGHVEVNGFSYVGGVGGKNAYANWTDITVEVDDTSYVKATSTDEENKAYRTYVGGVVGFNGEGGHTFKNITSNIDVIGDVCDIGGIFGIAHYGNKFENITCTGDVTNTVGTHNDGEDAATDVLETGLIAGVWHNEKGYTVTFTNISATGTIKTPNVEGVSFVNGGLIGKAYSASNNTAENSGSLIIDDGAVWPIVPPTGSNSLAYTKEVDGYVRVWGEGGGNSKESFVLKLYSDETLMATTQLNNVSGIIDGDVYVTWNFFYPESNDEYWTTTWEEGHPNADAQPTKVELYIDGTLVATTDVQMNGADGINPVVWSELGGVKSTRKPVAKIGDTEYKTLAEALAAVTDGDTITLLADITLTDTLTIAADDKIVLDLAGFDITYESTTQGEAMITNKGNLTINDTVGEGVINYNYIGAADSTYGKGNYTISNAGTLTVNGGKITIANLRAHAKYPIDNNSTTGDAILVINGGHLYNYNTSAIRQFCNSTTNKNSVTVNGGLVEGYCAIWVQNPGAKTVNGTLSITGGEVKTTAAAYVNGTSELKDVSSKIYCTIDGEGGAWSEDSAVSITGGTINENVSLAEEAPETLTVDKESATFNGYLELPASSNTVVAKIGDTEYETLQAVLDAAAAGKGNVTVEILADIDLANVDWNPVTVSAPNYPVVTVNGNNKTITGLNDMLFAGTWAGGSGLIINDLTIKDSTIVNDENDTKGTVGVGAFIGYPQASATITLNNCHLVNSTVKGGHWTGGLIGMAGGYNGNDGPVFMNLTIEGCSVTGSTITGKGSAGGIIGHGSCAAWTNVVIEDTTVSNNIITSSGSSTNKAGAVMGTIGAAGQPTTANGETKTGGASVAATVSGNTVTSGGTNITTIYGRQGTSTGMLYVTGGTYDNYPIEENVSYAAPAEGYAIVENADGTYGVQEKEETTTELYISQISASLDSSLALNIYFAKTEGTWTADDDYYAVIEHTKATGEVVKTEIPYSDWVPSNNNKTVRYTGIAAKEMADKIAITVYDAEGTQISKTYETSLRDYAIGSLQQYSQDSAYARFLPVYINMLNYGAAAQTKFNYNISDPAYIGAEAFQSYATKDHTIEANENWSTDESVYAITVSLENTLLLNVYFNDVKEGMYATYSYTTHAGTVKEKTVDYTSFISGWGHLGVAVPLAIADTDALVTVTLFNSDGTEAGKAVYSANGYLKGMIDSGETDLIYSELAKFGASAKEAFVKK